MSRRLVLAFLLTLVLSGVAYAALTVQWTKKSATVVPLTTQLNSLASNGFSAASSNVDNTIGVTNVDGFTWCRVEAKVTHAANPSANAAVSVWFLKSTDGANFDDTPTASITTGSPNVTIPITQGQTATRQSIDTVCPFGLFKVAVQNSGSGQTWAASGNTLTILFATTQGN